MMVEKEGGEESEDDEDDEEAEEEDVQPVRAGEDWREKACLFRV